MINEVQGSRKRTYATLHIQLPSVAPTATYTTIHFASMRANVSCVHVGQTALPVPQHARCYKASFQAQNSKRVSCSTARSYHRGPVAAADAQHDESKYVHRRALLLAAVVATASSPLASLAGPAQQEGLTEFTNSRQGYRVDRPQQWEQTSKAGADVLFTDPANKSTTVGVTVSPIKIESLEKFGDVETVRKRLVATEKQKESTLDVALIQESSHRGKSGTLIYDIEYELNSTRGRKRILSTVGIANKKLFIVNGNFKCSPDGCNGQDANVTMLRQIASTFDIIS